MEDSFILMFACGYINKRNSMEEISILSYLKLDGEMHTVSC